MTVDDDLRAVLRDLLDDCAVELRRRHASPALVSRCNAAVTLLDRPPVAPVDSPRLPPMHDAPTTQAMRERALPRAGTLRMRVVRHVLGSGDAGLTDDQLERSTGHSHQSVSACRNGLVRDGWLCKRLDDAGAPVTRENSYGNEAQVWVLSGYAEARLRQGG